MTFLLASVTSAAEAEVAVAHGADIVDAKDPAKGALGALPDDAVRAIVADVAGRRPVSAVAGDRSMRPDALARAADAMASTGVDIVKVGLYPDPQRPDCIAALAPVARRTRIVGVLFADHGGDDGLLPSMAASGFSGAMLDTAWKGHGRLIDHRPLASLRAFVAECRAHGLTAGLAGALEAPDVPRLLLLDPDVLGFRGALCARHDRGAGLDPAAVETIRALIPGDPRARPEPPVSKVDYRLMMARGVSGDPSRRADATDRIFVRDFVLPVRIGAYAHERVRPQSVRFNVDARVLRPGHAPAGMRDVFSYDVITDGIRLLVAGEHVALVETLAERIAALVLTHPQVAGVTVRVEKLEVGPGGVGVEIARDRSSEVAQVHRLFPLAAADDRAKAAE